MTGNEIIKALEHNASKCKFYEDGHDGGLFESTLDLINRQKTEIERLEDELHRAKVEISKHFDYMDAVAGEAIKEFAERLKKRRNLNQMCIAIVSKDGIDNLVKEITAVK